jgi:regulatory protein
VRPRLSLKGRGLQLLAQREHSRSELRRKLLAHLQAETRAKRAARRATEAGDDRVATNGDVDGSADASRSEASTGDADEPAKPEAVVEAVLDWLQAHRHLCEERFAESRVHARSARFGNLRIRQELAQHGVALSPEATQQLKDTELQRARDVWRRKYGEPATDVSKQASQARFLAARGFSADVIRRVVRGSFED